MDGINPALLEKQIGVTFVPASIEQIARIKELAKNAIPVANLSADAATAIIDKLETRKHFKYASEPQRKMMVEWLGLDPQKASRMKKWDATKWINTRMTEFHNELVEAGWTWEAAKALKPWQLLPAVNRIQKEVNRGLAQD
jgi:hypothetical protein